MCDFCGERCPYRLIPFWDWPGKVRFQFCSPQCRRDAEAVLGQPLIDAFTKDRRLAK
jgi:hypothetical protein